MHGYDIHEALSQNCEIHTPWVWGLGSGMGLIWPYSKSVLTLSQSSLKLFFNPAHVGGGECMVIKGALWLHTVKLHLYFF